VRPKFQTSISIDAADSDGHKYVVTIKQVKKINMDDIHSTDLRERSLPLNFFNILFKFYLRQLNLVEHGRTGKFFDPKSRRKVEGTDLFTMPGYHTSFHMYQGGLFLKVDLCNRIVRTLSVLGFIN